jgi:deoxyhypusine synthase
MTGSFGARQVGRGWSALKDISDDRDCSVVLTVSGAMTVAKLGSIFGALISRGIVNAIVTTGAVVTHALVEEMGMKHYKLPDSVSDTQLAELKLNRVYDSIEPEKNLETLDQHVREALGELKKSRPLGSFELVRHLSTELLHHRKSGFLTSALRQDADVFVPALTDSELGLSIFRFNQSQSPGGLFYDPFVDLSHYAEWLQSRRRVAFLTLGGGVPRNWAQQMLPFLRSGEKRGRHSNLPRVKAAIRICPDDPSLGHLSGSTYSEGITWNKFTREDNTDFVEIPCDATIVFPLLAKALLTYWDRTHIG